MMGDEGLSVRYPETPWNSIFGLRNIISHEYAAVNANEIFSIIKGDLDALELVVKHILSDLHH